MKRNRLTSKIAAANDKSRKPVEGRELEGFDYDKSKAKVLKKALHNINVSLGTLISAMKDVSMIRGSEVTPDGKLGGKGFIMSFRDIKQTINESVSNLSDVTDTIADELTNPMWGLSTTEKKKVKKEQEQVEDKVEEAEEVVEESVEEPASKEDKSEEIVEEEVKESEDTEEAPASKDSSDTDINNKYRNLLASSNDETAGTLGRTIMANLLIGEK
jgi:hypothetical protein